MLVHSPARDIELSVAVEANLHLTGIAGIAVRILTVPLPPQLPLNACRKSASAAWATADGIARAAITSRTRVLALLMTDSFEHEDPRGIKPCVVGYLFVCASDSSENR